MEDINIKNIIELSTLFQKKYIKYPTKDNLIENINKNDILEHAKGSCILVHEKVINLINDFINLKKEYGSNTEKRLYKNMTDKQFIIRLIKKRPFYFYNRNDIS